jgi:hypothetical protein
MESVVTFINKTTRKLNSNIYPIPLNYFSIAFNGMTWYEKYFQARQTKNHDLYRSRVDLLLKSKPTFIDFLRTSAPPAAIAMELESYFEKSTSMEIFFQSLPKFDRCRLVRDWIDNYMSSSLSGVFDNRGWILSTLLIGGSQNKKRRKTTRKYFLPPLVTIRYSKTVKDFGIDVNHVA